MYQVVYLSRATRRLDQDQLLDIHRQAMGANAEVDVTGLLLFDGRRFIQALEGPQAAVEAVMTRIANDPRHDSIDYLARREITDRQFGTWSMDYKLADDGCCSSDFITKVKEGVEYVRDPELQAAFIGFASLSSNRAPGYRCSAEA